MAGAKPAKSKQSSCCGGQNADVQNSHCGRRRAEELCADLLVHRQSQEMYRKEGLLAGYVVVQCIQNSRRRTGYAEQLLCSDFVCDISAALSSLFRSPQAKIPGAAAGTTAGP